MNNKVLKNKPLVEVILEVQWELTKGAPGLQIDPHYKILIGRLFDKIQDDYPVHEQLQTATIPDEIIGRTVQHRFRQSKDGWPLIQIGPGVMTVNETEKYIWSEYKMRCIKAIEALYSSYPSDDIKISSVILRYIDAIEFDFVNENIYEFLSSKMNLNLNIPEKLFEKGIEKRPRGINWQSSYSSSQPKGMMDLHVFSGHKQDKLALLWETIFRTTGSDLPELPSDFESWIDQSHELTDHWFFTLIEGELEGIFSNE